MKLKEELQAAGSLDRLEGRTYYAEYLAQTDPFGSDLPHPKSHVAYGYATQICILDKKTDKIRRIIAAHDVGRAINPTNVEGQIEGGVVMGMGYALRENYELKDCIPPKKYASLHLFRSDEVPEIKAVIVERPGLDIASGAIGIGEITCIPTAPAIADAYYTLDGVRRTRLPIADTPYVDEQQGNPERKNRTLVVNKDARCIGCLECMHACAKTYFKSHKLSQAFLRVQAKKGIGNKSEIEGMIIRPVVCIQCGKCAKVCPIGAIRQNRFGAYVVDHKMCINCGKCRDACPFGLMVESKERNVTMKCIACGACVAACSMGVLSIANPTGKAQHPAPAEGR